MTRPNRISQGARSLLALVFFIPAISHGVEITSTTYEGRAQFQIRTQHATWLYDRAGGGFSRLIDRDGRDWIGFSKNPLKTYPDSAAAGYRGIPNLVFGSQNPDAGAGHPGFDQCETEQIDSQTLRTRSRSGQWIWSWQFHENRAVFTMEQIDSKHPWWFLYEGPIAGSFSPSNKFWATNELGLSTEIPDNRRQLFGKWQWVYFGDRNTPRVLYLRQHEPDELQDTLWYLGSSDQGAASAPDGMMVFGFGRGPGTKPQFRQANVSVSIGFLSANPSASGPPLSRDSQARLASQLKRPIASTATVSLPKISLWQGSEQTFGQNGRPQRWINVLGNVSPPASIQDLRFQIDHQDERPLSWGTDLHRLALPGDFNIELPYETISPGAHRLTIRATDLQGNKVSKTATLNVIPTKQWPLPYRIDFSRVSSLEDAVQIVDGHWELTPEGVRTQQRWYDRVLSLGDTSWTNYEARIRLTLHNFTPSQRHAPTYNVTHFGVALRWQGHTKDGRQPSRRWYPLGAQGEFLLANDLDQCQWRVLHNGGPGWRPTYGNQRHAVTRDTPFWIRAQVFSDSSDRTHYRFKQWASDNPEPEGWAVESSEPGETDLKSGALCLVPHNSDVTIHEIDVRSLQTDTAR